MNKLKLILVLLIAVLLVGCTNNNSNEEKYLEEITYKEFLEKLENKETFILEIMATSCTHCQTFTPKFVSVLEEYDIKAYKINLSNISEEDENSLKQEQNYEGTPEVIFFFEGKEKSKLQRIGGDVSKTKIISKLKSAGYIE